MTEHKIGSDVLLRTIITMVRRGTYIPLDVHEVLTTFMVDNVPDPVRLSKLADDVIRGTIQAARGEIPQISVCSECAPTLWSEGKFQAAIEVERIWDRFVGVQGVNTFCGIYSRLRCQLKEHPKLRADMFPPYCCTWMKRAGNLKVRFRDSAPPEKISEGK